MHEDLTLHWLRKIPRPEEVDSLSVGESAVFEDAEGESHAALRNELDDEYEDRHYNELHYPLRRPERDDYDFAVLSTTGGMKSYSNSPWLPLDGVGQPTDQAPESSPNQFEAINRRLSSMRVSRGPVGMSGHVAEEEMRLRIEDSQEKIKNLEILNLELREECQNMQSACSESRTSEAAVLHRSEERIRHFQSLNVELARECETLRPLMSQVASQAHAIGALEGSLAEMTKAVELERRRCKLLTEAKEERSSEPPMPRFDFLEQLRCENTLRRVESAAASTHTERPELSMQTSPLLLFEKEDVFEALPITRMSTLALSAASLFLAPEIAHIAVADSQTDITADHIAIMQTRIRGTLEVECPPQVQLARDVLHDFAAQTDPPTRAQVTTKATQTDRRPTVQVGTQCDFPLRPLSHESPRRFNESAISSQPLSARRDWARTSRSETAWVPKLRCIGSGSAFCQTERFMDRSTWQHFHHIRSPKRWNASNRTASVAYRHEASSDEDELYLPTKLPQGRAPRRSASVTKYRAAIEKAPRVIPRAAAPSSRMGATWQGSTHQTRRTRQRVGGRSEREVEDFMKLLKKDYEEDDGGFSDSDR